MASSAPLPPGWEARWDPNQRAYFYIDHNTKKTSWTDPRIGYHQPQVQQYGYGASAQPFSQFHQQAAQSLNQQTHQFSSTGQGQSIAMATKYKQFGSTITSTEGESDEDFGTDMDFDQLFSSSSTHEHKVDIQKLHTIKQMYPSAPEDMIKEKLKTYNNVQVKVTNDLFNLGYKREAPGQHPPPRTDDMVERLKAMFPTASEDIVGEILRGANNDEREARNTLETLGFKKVFPETHRTTTPTRQPSPAKKPTSSRTTSPARRTPSPKPSPKPTSPAKPKLSEEDKGKLERKIHGQFPTYDISVVKMALQVCNYEETRVKAVLERMGETSLAEGKKAPPSRPGTSKYRTRSPSPKPLSPSNLEPVSILSDTSSSSTRPSTSSSQSSGSRSHTTSKTSVGTRPTSSKATARVPSPKKSTHTSRQQQVQNARAKKVTDTRSSRQVVSRQPQRSDYVSAYRTEAKGHDPSLCVGPNKDLLLTNYALANGPNPELRQGPDPSRVRGSQGAVGPDRSLHCGPEYLLSKGPSNQNLLVTSI